MGKRQGNPRIGITFSESEIEAIDRVRGEVPFATWVRRRAVESATGQAKPASAPAVSPVTAPARPASAPARQAVSAAPVPDRRAGARAAIASVPQRSAPSYESGGVRYDTDDAQG